MRRLLLVAAIVALAACGNGYTPPPEAVVIVAVQCEKRGGMDDCITTVQFPDSLRYQRVGRWGYEGDAFKAYRHGGRGWSSTP